MKFTETDDDDDDDDDDDMCVSSIAFKFEGVLNTHKLQELLFDLLENYGEDSWCRGKFKTVSEVVLDWKLVARYSGFRCRRRRIFTKSVEDRASRA